MMETKLPGPVQTSIPSTVAVVPRVSFEFFPPTTPELEQQLFAAVQRLAPLDPAYVSVTYGAGGTTRERTLGVIRRLLSETKLAPAAHLTCVEATREEVDEVIREYWAAGVRHIVALRGDPPGQLGGAYTPGPESYRHATDLVAAITAIAPFEVSVGGYPEKHPESPSIAHDIDVLKAKVDAGASRITTQFFLDTEQFFRWVDQVRAAGISIPIVPGVMPVTSVKGLKRMAQISHARIPDRIAKLFDGLDNDPGTRALVSASASSEMCAELVAQGFTDLHFYTMNRAELVYAVCRMLGVTPKADTFAEPAVQEAST
jgi:methylenetetrahydrofolate reductase (NADPH)